MAIEERVLRLENAFVMLTQLARGMDERMDTHLEWIETLKAAQENSENRIAALANAQIKTEKAQKETDRQFAALINAQIKTEEALARFTEKTEEALARLAEAQAQSDRRLNALMDSIREGRNGKP